MIDKYSANYSVSLYKDIRNGRQIYLNSVSFLAEVINHTKRIPCN